MKGDRPCGSVDAFLNPPNAVTMNLEESYRILGIDSDTKEADRFRAYGELRNRLEEKLAHAPTEGLKGKYGDALARLDEAIEQVEASIDASELPILGGPDVSPQVPIPEAERSEAESGRLARNRSMLPWIGVFGVVAVAALVFSGLSWRRQAEVERERLAAIELARAEEVQKAELAVVRAKIEPLREPFAIFAQKVGSILKGAEQRRVELESAKTVAEREGSRDEQEVAALRMERYAVFQEWLQERLRAYDVESRLAKVDRRVEEGKFEEARALLADPPPRIEELEMEIAKAESEKYGIPLKTELAKRRFDQAQSESEKAVERRDYREAIDLLKPYEHSEYVNAEAKARLDALYRLKADEVLERVRHATDVGELTLARRLMDSLEEDPIPSELAEQHAALVNRLNAEYALESAVTASRRALADNAFAQAKEPLTHLRDDAHVGDRANRELERIGAQEEAWRAQELANSGPGKTVLEDAEAVANTGESESERNFDVPPRLLSKVEPLYPDLLRQNNTSGYVELEWQIGLDGRVRDISVADSSHPEFEQPAMEAVQRWRFRPARKDGSPVTARVRQKLLFNPR